MVIQMYWFRMRVNRPLVFRPNTFTDALEHLHFNLQDRLIAENNLVSELGLCVRHAVARCLKKKSGKGIRVENCPDCDWEEDREWQRRQALSGMTLTLEEAEMLDVMAEATEEVGRHAGGEPGPPGERRWSEGKSNARDLFFKLKGYARRQHVKETSTIPSPTLPSPSSVEIESQVQKWRQKRRIISMAKKYEKAIQGQKENKKKRWACLSCFGGKKSVTSDHLTETNPYSLFENDAHLLLPLAEPRQVIHDRAGENFQSYEPRVRFEAL